MCFGIGPANHFPCPMETGRRQNKDGMGRETGPCQRSAGISTPDDGTKRMEKPERTVELCHTPEKRNRKPTTARY